MPRAVSGLVLTISAVLVAAVAGAQPQKTPIDPDLVSVLRSLAERTQQYYDRFISIICTETVRQQDLKINLQASGRPRVTVYELSVSRNPKSQEGSDFRVDRTLLEVNGRPARTNEQPGCTDPKTGTPEPLAFLLPKNQPGFRFALSDRAEGGPPGTRALDFMEWPAERVSVKWTANCFDAEGGGQEGRVWYDPVTFDILRVDSRLSKPFRVPLPQGLNGIHPSIRVERSETTVRFERVRFENPDEIVLLPESIETLTVFRGVPSLRTAQKLSNFRRFLSESTLRTSAF
jgi:hypothetical protein